MMRPSALLWPALLVLMLAGCADSGGGAAATAAPDVERVVDIPAIAGKSPAEVEAILGPPSTRTTARNKGQEHPNYLYRGDSIDIRYVDGKAEWIDVQHLSRLAFTPETMRAFGFEQIPPPTFQNAGVIRWENHALPGVRNAYLFPSRPTGVHYVYFQVTQEP